MAFNHAIRFRRIALLIVITVALLLEHGACSSSFNRSSFPDDFVFGSASSAYQYEGAAREDGKGPSIWDTFTHEYPDKIADGTNGDVADDFYHRYKEDVQNMKKMGMDAFRFSISWPRILPNGSLSGGINKEGVNFYNNLINDIISNGMQPFVTIFHWDVPQALEDKYMGFLSPLIQKDFVDYSDVCFKEFGDRVKHWITINEPNIFCSMGYASGTLAPGRCSPWVGNCTGGNSGTEPYTCGHNMLLAHSAAVKLYKEKYQAMQGGKIGITVATHWFLPHSPSKADTAAAKRSLAFLYGWFMDPLTYGDYPVIMSKSLANRLTKFTKEQSESLKGSYDFFGVNYYSTYFSASVPASNLLRQDYSTDSRANLSASSSNGIELPQPFKGSWINIYPPGLRDLMLYTTANYKKPVIYITENGVHDLNNGGLTMKEALNDDIRLSYHRGHLLALRSAIRQGADVKGYFAWSFMDNFEWGSGYTNLFGLYYVDYKNNLARHPKKSAIWFSMFLKK